MDRRQPSRLLVRDRTEHEIQRARDPTRRAATVGDILMVRVVAGAEEYLPVVSRRPVDARSLSAAVVRFRRRDVVIPVVPGGRVGIHEVG